MLAGMTLDSPLLSAIALGVLGMSWGYAARARRHASLAVLGALGALVAFAFPVGAVLIGAMAASVLDLRPDDDLDRPALGTGAIVPALCVGGGAFVVIGSWSAARAALDPTAAGLVLGLTCAGIAASLVALTPLGERRWVDPIGLGVCALGSLFVLGALPYRMELHVLPLAGVEDPRTTLAALMGLVAVPGGIAIGIGGRRLDESGSAQTLGWLALAAGVVAGVHAGPEYRDQALGLACVAGLVTVLIARQWLAKALGPLVWAAAAAIILAPLSWPEKELLQSRAYILRTSGAPAEEAARKERLEISAGGWGSAGAVSVETRRDTLARVALDGFTVTPTGRAEATSAFAGHLGPALSAASDTALVLSDGLASATPGLILQGVATITVAVPDPGALRALHEVAPERTEALLHPSVRLEAGGPELVLADHDPVDILIEISRTPWQDASQGVPMASALERRRDGLVAGGVYVLVVPLNWMTEEDVRGLLHDFAETFPAARAFRPPEGADQLVLAGWANEDVPSWPRVVQAAALGLDGLLPLEIRSPLDLADRSLAGREALVALGEGGARHPGWRLSGVLHTRPGMYLPLFEDHIEGGDWLVGVDETALEALALRADTNRCMLDVLASAASGDFPAIFEGGKCLDQRNLDPLVQPHLDAARQALELATAEGPNSLHWRDCLAHVSTVLMLHPSSAEAWAVSGRCRLVADRTNAARDFEKALEYDASHLDALLGLSQVQVRNGQLGLAEKSLRQATRYHALEWRPHYYLGALLMDLGRYDEAEDELAKSRAYAKEESALPLAALANVYLLQGRPNDAIFWAEAAVAREENARSLHILGLTWLDLEQPQAAERSFRKAILDDPNYWPAHAGLGRARATQGDYLDAVESFSRVLEYEPNNAEALASLERAKALAEEQQP